MIKYRGIYLLNKIEGQYMISDKNKM